jgi:Ca2+-binding EF-hand superfamily protein
MLQIVSNPKYKPPEGTDHHGLIEVPSKGTLSFTFCVAKAIEGALGTASNFKLDASTFLEKQARLLRHIAGRRREHLLIAFWRQFSGMSDRQHLVLNAITKDFAVTPSQLLAIYEDEVDHHATITHSLLPCLTDGLFTRYMAASRMQNLSSCVTLYRRVQSLLAFNPEHTTGHYKLDLELSSSRIVAQKLMLLDAWETLIDQQLGRPDTSQRGNRSHFRNERYLNSQVPAASVAEWNLPPSGIFEFDYATSLRPSLDAPTLSKDALNRILLTMGESTCSVADKLAALRQNADQVYLTSMQLRELMGIFKDEHSRCEIFIIFAFRITDIQNRKLIMTRVEDIKTLNATYLRIGHATFFPFVQPEQALFELDLTYHDQRLCLNMFCLFSVKERRENLRDVQYELPDGSMDKLETGVPKTWETLSKVPTVGVVRGRYVCAPEHRKIQMRQEFLENYGFWTFPDLTEDKVYWWYTMSDVPIIIIHLISYIMSTWDIRNPSECYSIVVKDKPFIGLSTFEDAFSKRFGPAADNSPLKELFRYFDDSGDGKVSEQEWSTLNQVWAEVRLSVQEFAQFLERMFKEEVTDAWDFFDSDRSGTVTEDEWSKAVQSLGYFGPLKTIFAFLDPTGRGVLQKQAFVHLANFKKGILAFKTHS